MADQGSTRQRWRLVLMIVLAASVIGVAVWANAWKEDLRVAATVVAGNHIVPTDEILPLLAVKKGQKLFDVDLFAARARVLSHHFIKDAWVNRDLPGTITVTVSEREPVAMVVAGQILYVDEEGFVLPHVRSERIRDLPVITGAGGSGVLKPGMMIGNGSLREAVEVVATARQLGDGLGMMVSEVHTGRGDIILYTAEYGVPVVLGRGDYGAKLVKLDAFWHQFVVQRGARELRYVDLRFTDQVVVRWAPETKKQQNAAG
jgi:cell division protein FtsQ